MYNGVVKLMYGLCLWEQQGDQFAEGVWWSYTQDILDEVDEPLRYELSVAYIVALFSIYQEFICSTFPEYVERNDDWEYIVEGIDYKPDERALYYLSGKYGLPFVNTSQSLLSVLLTLANHLRKPIGQYLGQLYQTPEKAFAELTLNFPIFTRYDIEEGRFSVDRAGFEAFCTANLIFPNSIETTNEP